MHFLTRLGDSLASMRSQLLWELTYFGFLVESWSKLHRTIFPYFRYSSCCCSWVLMLFILTLQSIPLERNLILLQKIKVSLVRILLNLPRFLLLTAGSSFLFATWTYRSILLVLLYISLIGHLECVKLVLVILYLLILLGVFSHEHLMLVVILLLLILHISLFEVIHHGILFNMLLCVLDLSIEVSIPKVFLIHARPT
jgi:hypothetical protein